jgi:hypothetical protein
MRIGTLGAGEVAQALAIHLLKAGHEVLLSDRRGPPSLKQLVSKLDKAARAVMIDEAAKARLWSSPFRGPKSRRARKIAGVGRPHSD